MIPKYIQLKEQINEGIISKKYPLHTKLPTELELAKEYNVSRATVRSALDLLMDEGIIEKKWGSGNTVIGSKDNTSQDCVALVIPNSYSDKCSVIIEELSSHLYKKQLRTNVYITNDDIQTEREILTDISKDLFAGYIIMPTASALPSLNLDLFHKLLRWQNPVLFIGAIPGEINNVSNIRFDDYDCGYRSARSLINAGHKNIGGVFNNDDLSSLDYYHGFIDALRDSHIPLLSEYIYRRNNCSISMEEYFNRIQNHVSALVCDNDEYASEVIRICENNSVAIPGQLSLVYRSHDDINKIKSINSFSDEYTIYDSLAPVFSCYKPVKNISQEIANAFFLLKKEGKMINQTIGYKPLSQSVKSLHSPTQVF